MSNSPPADSGSLPRRDLLKLGVAGLGLSATGAMPDLVAGDVSAIQERPDLGPAPATPYAAPALEVVRVGFVGVGGMGGAHVRNFLGLEGVQIVALCDIDEDRNAEVASWVTEDGRPRPTLYGRNETDFVRMCETEDLDLVLTATPWEWHVPVCVAAMENGTHAATEVPAAYRTDDCWQLVECAEKYQKHCLMMEYCD